jgi:hypothetical protein
VAISLAMLLFQPVPGGRHYEYALLLSLALTAIWALAEAGHRAFFSKGILAAVLIAGIVLGAANLTVLRPDSEIVRAYATVFEALESGANPYTAGTIYHEIESRGPVLGNFNYPPLEIYPYYLAYRIARRWDIAVLTAAMIVLQALCFLVLLAMFPRVRPALFLPFLPLILLGEIKTNAAMSFLLASLILWAIKRDMERPRALRGRLIAVLFGLGLMTKSLVIPLMAAYYARTVAVKGRRALALVGVDVSIALAAAALVMAPFGVVEVLKNTALFNVVLGQRAVLTTFYPNVLSGPFAALGLHGLYPFAALAVFALAVAASSRLDTFRAMLASASAFLLAASTPEPQFVPALVFLVVVAQTTARVQEAAPNDPEHSASPKTGRGRLARALKGTIVLGLAVFWLAAQPAAASGASPDHPGPPAGRWLSPETRSLFSPPVAPGPAADPAPDPPPPVPVVSIKRSRAWLQLGAFMAVTTVNYWTGNSFPEDRDFGLDLGSQWSRIVGLEGWRFDSNQFSLNWSHILAGGIYYQFGRACHASWPYAWMMAFAASAWWEVGAEPKEVIAINDQIITGLGAFPVGEPWYQLGRFLGHQPGLFRRALSFLNPVVKFNHWLDRKDPGAREYPQPGWHELILFAGARRLSSAGETARTDLVLGFQARLLGLPEYARPGEVRRAVKDVYGTEIALDYAVRGGHAEETRYFSKAVAGGRHYQRIDERGRGYSLVLGFGSAFEYFKKRPIADYDADPVPVKTDLGRLRLGEPRNFTDKLAVLHVAGPVLDWTLFRRGLRLRAFVEAYGDFALVHSKAINDFSLSHDITGLKTTVFYYGYYYGFGGTLRAGARLDLGNIRLQGLFDAGVWGSADHLHRFQDEITNNSHLSDRRVRVLFGAGWRVPGSPLELVLEAEGVRRHGRLGAVSVGSFEGKACAGLALHF